MDQFNMTDNVNTLFQSLENFTQKEGVIGKPVTQGDKTFLPVVTLTVGYGGGNASMGGQSGSTSGYMAGATSGQTGSTGTGTGAHGLGAKLSTEAVIVIDSDKVSMMPMNASGASQIADKIPQIISQMGKGGKSGQSASSSQPSGSSSTSY